MNKLIIIADSGSSKTDWVVVDENGQQVDRIRTIGFNPYFQTTEQIFKETQNGFKHLSSQLSAVKKVHFYGAGCSSREMNQIVSDALKPVFLNSKINIYHDLEAAAVATLGDHNGIACIIGTGSNSCVWENNLVIDNIPSHGFIFGDEASGSYLGIELLKLYLSGHLDQDLTNSFNQTFGLSIEQILNSAYREPSPNVFLAKFASFYSQHPDNESLQKIIYNGFNKFFEVRILPYTNYQKLNLGFVGSIAFYFQPILKRVAKEHNFTITQILQCPINNLVAYHIKNTQIINF